MVREMGNNNNNNEEKTNASTTTSAYSSPGSTPGVPLVGGYKNGHAKKKSLLSNCKCLGANDWTLEDGTFSPRVFCSLPSPPPVSTARKVGAEFVGTFILMFAGTATAIVNQKTEGAETLIGCAASSGLAVMIIILSTGHISGAHLNPAVTISFAALKHFPWKHVGELAAIAVGATVMLNILIAGPATGASMNPVRTLGPAIAANNYKDIWVYLIAPILGALGGAGIYTLVKLPEEDAIIAKASAPNSFRG